ncbi:LysR family transcriptional regulator [Brooklawnia cerclae]|uniref:DNA-binding transcriptional LysR family regulator n=1 Tax=Brooklawnia cerclae TaxID=349934 RepID=A0ABX0SJ65_9ACTN|nr:LysR family transcriptional regulator [Brooklawnia cerclae]NIH56781.1 DNA-binding transcriptional LysR family regulator [Brooklawnia cerclae]
MQLRQLEYFLAVARDGSFSSASETLHVVQSGVSTAIRALERELGVPLFERTARGVVLSDAGTALLPHAQRVLADVQAAAEAVDEVRRGVRGTVVAGVLPVLGLVDLPRAVAAFRADHPHVAVHLHIAGTAKLAGQLDEGEVDFALMSPAGPLPGDLSLTRLGDAPFVGLVPAGHELAGRDRVDLADLMDCPFVDSPAGFGNRDLLDQELGRRGLRRSIVVEAPDAWAIPVLVGKGVGVAMVPAFVAEGHAANVKVLELATPLQWSLFLATADHHPPSHAARLLIRHIRAALQPIGGSSRPSPADQGFH